MKNHGKKYSILVFVTLIFSISACQDNDNINIATGSLRNDDTTFVASGLDMSNWQLPVNEILDGGPGVDGIPALLNPDFIKADEQQYLSEDDLIVGVKVGSDIKAYPHQILDWHEIINDNVGEKPLSVTYCPLTGSAIGWDLKVDDMLTTFGVSGLLYNSNLMPYDRRTGSVWSQLLLKGVSGTRAGESITTFQLVETTWRTWKNLYPNTNVVSTATGFSRNYGFYPYGNFREVSRPFFSVSNFDERLFCKERVHGIITDEGIQTYRFESFTEDKIILDEVDNNPVIIIGSQQRNFLMSFFAKPGRTYSMLTENKESVIFKDNLRNEYDLFGKSVDDSNQAENLSPTLSFIAYWFAFPAFYDNVSIYAK